MRLFLCGVTAALLSVPFVSLTVASGDTHLYASAAAAGASVFRWVAPREPLAAWPSEPVVRAQAAPAPVKEHHRLQVHAQRHFAVRHYQKPRPARHTSTAQQSGPNFFDMLGMLPDPVSEVAAPTSLLGGLGFGVVSGGAWALIMTGASTSLREHREMSNAEACQAFLGSLPLIGMLPVWDKVCVYPDTCYNPEYVTYAGLREDDPVGRFERWKRWMKKYCPDVDWHKYADRARWYISTTSSPG